MQTFPLEIIHEIINFMDGFEREQAKLICKNIKPIVYKYNTEEEAIRNGEVRNITFGVNSLYYAVKYERLDIAKVILKKVDRLDVAIRTCCDIGNLEMLKYFIGLSYQKISYFNFRSLEQIDDETINSCLEDKFIDTMLYYAKIDLVSEFEKLPRDRLHMGQLSSIALVAAEYESNNVLEYVKGINKNIAMLGVARTGYGYQLDDEYVDKYNIWAAASGRGNINIIKHIYDKIGTNMKTCSEMAFPALYGTKRFEKVKHIIDRNNKNTNRVNWKRMVLSCQSYSNDKGAIESLKRINNEDIAYIVNVITPRYSGNYRMLDYLYCNYGKYMNQETLNILASCGLNINVKCSLKDALEGGCLELIRNTLGREDPNMDIGYYMKIGRHKTAILLLEYDPRKHKRYQITENKEL